MPGLLYADDLVLCGESEEDLKAKVECFVKMYRRRGLKVNAGKNKMMVLNVEEELECEVHVKEMRTDRREEAKGVKVYYECFVMRQ